MYKTYMIGGKEFHLRPLTQRQRYLASPMERKLRETILKLGSLSPSHDQSTPKEQLSKIYDLSVEMDQIIFSEDEAFEKFLATILTPADAEKWTPEMIERNKEIMWEITEDVQAEVLQDFFSRAMNSRFGSPASISPSMNEQRQSATSGTPSNSAIPTTS
jgi:hypothetical protein